MFTFALPTGNNSQLFDSASAVMYVCVCEGAHTRMNITSIDQANVGRKGCRPQQLINIPLITWGTECVCVAGRVCVGGPPKLTGLYI